MASPSTSATPTPIPIPEWFRSVFRELVMALQPRGPFGLDVQAVYYAALAQQPEASVTAAARHLAQNASFFPTTSEWYQTVLVMAPAATPPPASFRRLEELDELARNDPERDEICKRLSPEDERRLMARYGVEWAPAR